MSTNEKITLTVIAIGIVLLGAGYRKKFISISKVDTMAPVGEETDFGFDGSPINENAHGSRFPDKNISKLNKANQNRHKKRLTLNNIL